MNNTIKHINVGDILVSTWGYDARFADFFKVVSRTNKSVRIVALAQTITGDWNSGTSRPATPEVATDASVLRKVKTSAFGECVKISDYANAYIWDGKPVHTYNHH